eukprot:760101-Hanusia_phi.AAC.1
MPGRPRRDQRAAAEYFKEEEKTSAGPWHCTSRKKKKLRPAHGITAASETCDLTATSVTGMGV